MTGFPLSILAVDRICYEGTVIACTAVFTTGSRTLEAHHEPFVSVLAAGIVSVQEEGGRQFSISVDEGLVRFENDACVFLVNLSQLT